MENSTEVPYKAKNRVTMWSSNPTPRHNPREKHNLKIYLHPNVHGSIIFNSQNMEAAKMSSTGEWIRKMWYIYAMEYYSAIKRMK